MFIKYDYKLCPSWIFQWINAIFKKNLEMVEVYYERIYYFENEIKYHPDWKRDL